MPTDVPWFPHMEPPGWLILTVGPIAIAAGFFVIFELIGHALSRLALRAGARRATVHAIPERGRLVALILAAIVIVADTGLA